MPGQQSYWIIVSPTALLATVLDGHDGCVLGAVQEGGVPRVVGEGGTRVVLVGSNGPAIEEFSAGPGLRLLIRFFRPCPAREPWSNSKNLNINP